MIPLSESNIKNLLKLVFAKGVLQGHEFEMKRMKGESLPDIEKVCEEVAQKELETLKEILGK